MIKKKLLKTLLVQALLLLSLLPGYAQQNSAERPVRIGVLIDNYPFSYLDSDGDVQGFAYELLKELTQTMGISCERIKGSTEYINAAFRDGKVDVLQSFARSTKRDSSTAFSVPYLTMNGQIFVRKNGPKIRDLSDLKGHQVLVHKGSVGEELLRKAGLDSSIRYVESVREALILLNKGEGDATLASRLTGLTLIGQLHLGNLKALDTSVEGYKVEYCIAVHKDNRHLLEQINEGLAILVNTGTFDKLYQKWFGFIEPVGYSTEQILLVIALGLFLALTIAAWSSLRQQKLKKRIEKQAGILKESEEKYHSIYDHANIAILLTSPDGRVFAANDYACRVLEHTETSLREASPFAIVDPSDSRLSRLLQERRLNGFVAGELKLRRANGEVFPGQISSSLFKDKDGNERATLVFRDMTKEKQMLDELVHAKERAEESDRLKTEFLHNISHEIRTPMNSIVGFSESLDQPGLSQKQIKEFTEIIINSSHRLLHQVDDILYVSMIETNQLSVYQTRIDLEEMLENLHTEYLKEAERKRLILGKPDIKGENNALLVSDSILLTKVFHKLLDNAIKYTERGSVAFGCTFHENQALFFVEDTGIGIPSNQLEEVFKHFSQVSPLDNRLNQGTGLGLTIVRGIVQRLGGSLQLFSKPGKGTRIEFTLALEPSDRVLNQY